MPLFSGGSEDVFRFDHTTRRWIGAGFVILLALTLFGARSLDAPLILYPSSGSLPAGFYIRSFQPVASGEIVAFNMPKKAWRYLEGEGQDDEADLLLIKPLAAGPGDHVCNDTKNGLRINGQKIAPTARYDSHGQELPVWSACRHLHEHEHLAISTFVQNSFDSRYFGPIDAASIKGVYDLVL